MKIIITGLIGILAAIAGYGGLIWSIIAFILYLVKDVPFNWLSVGVCIGGYVILIIMSIITGIQVAKTTKKIHRETLEQKITRFKLR